MRRFSSEEDRHPPQEGLEREDSDDSAQSRSKLVRVFVCACVLAGALCVMAMHILLAALKCTRRGGSALRALLLLGLKFVLL